MVVFCRTFGSNPIGAASSLQFSMHRTSQYNTTTICYEQVNEIDVEMTGNKNASVQFTTHRPFQQSTTHIEPVGFNPHGTPHDYAIEWTPGKVLCHVCSTTESPF